MVSSEWQDTFRGTAQSDRTPSEGLHITLRNYEPSYFSFALICLSFFSLVCLICLMCLCFLFLSFACWRLIRSTSKKVRHHLHNLMNILKWIRWKRSFIRMWHPTFTRAICFLTVWLRLHYQNYRMFRMHQLGWSEKRKLNRSLLSYMSCTGCRFPQELSLKYSS